MRHVKPFEDFVKNGVVKKISANKERAKNINEISEKCEKIASDK